MNYHIGTALIIDSFRKSTECPLCTVYDEVEAGILEEYQGESVMLDDCRDRVNRLGFCGKHFPMLQRSDNKLGVALQAHTRLNFLIKHLKQPASIKKALAAAEETEAMMKGCAVCDSIDAHMQRYYEMVPRLFAEEDGFESLYRRGKGFCMHHYTELLRHAKFAKSCSDDFLQTTYLLQRENLARLSEELDRFCGQFDYRNAGRPLGEASDALLRAMLKIRGKGNQ